MLLPCHDASRPFSSSSLPILSNDISTHHPPPHIPHFLSHHPSTLTLPHKHLTTPTPHPPTHTQPPSHPPPPPILKMAITPPRRPPPNLEHHNPTPPANPAHPRPHQPAHRSATPALPALLRPHDPRPGHGRGPGVRRGAGREDPFGFGGGEAEFVSCLLGGGGGGGGKGW